ncbi:DMT family transporter [Arsenicitalea aurantiaca]|uniref:DMT family transporter n=1 Tax=Arsenicitalea aurantiaca TaxID=1783274 RepID=A0A433XAB7_9HYPH|nr:DMT family transporter [Arsenicitalea aurantiaca]RUT30968.1 DMT family transporter [Arsenicitalea aurantiaca]
MTYAIAPVEERRLLGIALVLIGFLFFTLIDTSSKWLSGQGFPTNQVVFLRYAVHFVLIIALFAPRRGTALVKTARPGLEIARGLCLLGSTITNFLAISVLPLTVTGSIAFTMPLMICALSVPFLGEKVGWRRWLAILVGFGGVLIIVRPGTEAFHPAALLSLLSAGFTAFYMLLTRKLAGVDSAATQQFYSAAIAVACITPFAFHGWMWPSDPATWVAFFMMGVAGVAGHMLVSIAHRLAPASVIAPFSYFQIVFLSISSWLIFNQPPDVWIFVGAPVVMGSGLYIWLRERKLQKQLSAPIE